MPRDFRGYSGRPPEIRWPDAARVAVSIVINYEEGAEFTVSGGDPRNESHHEISEEFVQRPDPCMESHYEYGTRAGYWRIMEVLDGFGARATLSSCGRAVEVSPWLAKDASDRGHEVSAHGYRWESHQGLTEQEERERIARTVRAIEAATGKRPVGWHTRSAASENTRRLLVEEGGFLYDSNAYNDDLPYFLDVAGRRHLVMPYSFDTNDMQFHRTHRYVTGEDFATYVNDAYDWLWREGKAGPRMLSIGLHLRIIGRPGRIAALEAVLNHIAKRGGAWIARRDEIARYWIERSG